MLDDYATHEAERAATGIPPRPLSAPQVREVVDRLRSGQAWHGPLDLLALLALSVAPGVTEAAEVKAAFLGEVAHRRAQCPLLAPEDATRMLGTMLGGYCLPPLLDLLEDPVLGRVAAEQLSGTILIPAEAFEVVVAKAGGGHAAAGSTLRSWARAEWLSRRPALPAEMHLTVFKVDGETNTDDLSPARQAWSRADIPLHAQSLLEARLGTGRAPAGIRELAALGRPVVFVGDVVGTGSSRKSAVNSLLWHIGEDVPFVPNKRRGGVVLAGRMAPIFRDTLLDSGALAVECDPDAVARMVTGDHIVVRPGAGSVETAQGERLTAPALMDHRLLEGARAGGRVQWIIGRHLARRAGSALGAEAAEAAGAPGAPGAVPSPLGAGGFTLAQKIVGRACGVEGIPPGEYCEPVISTVGSQDTTGPMNRAELEDLACTTFAADLVLQTFCHTAAYPRAADIETQDSLPPFMGSRGAVVLRPGDGIIHSWLNKMLLPDQVGTGSDSHTRFPLGISFPAGSGLVAFAAAFGLMPLTMPESVLVRFSGRRRPGITLRDMVNAIPYAAMKQGLLNLDPAAERNAFSGRIIEIEGGDDLSVEEAFELTDSTAERSAAACTIRLSQQAVVRHLRSCLETLRELVRAGYEGSVTLQRRIDSMEAWLRSPSLLRADPGARYAEVLEIDMESITEPLLACPNDPDDVRPLSEVSGRSIDEVFIGSCMTNLGHFRSAGRILAGSGGDPGGDSGDPGGSRSIAHLWIAPPTNLVQDQLRRDGLYGVYGSVGARTETPGCSLCMGNQARVPPGATVVSTSTRNFPNRMGPDADVFLASAEVAALAARLGRLPTIDEYMAGVVTEVVAGAGATPQAPPPRPR